MHPAVLTGVYMNCRPWLPHHLSFDVLVFCFITTLGITLMVSVVTYVFVETPLKLLGFQILQRCLSSLEAKYKKVE